MAKSVKKNGETIQEPTTHVFGDLTSVHETYTDAMNVTASTDTIILVFGTKASPELPAKATVVVRLSPQFAIRVVDAISRVLKKVVTPQPPAKPARKKRAVKG